MLFWVLYLYVKQSIVSDVCCISEHWFICDYVDWLPFPHCFQFKVSLLTLFRSNHLHHLMSLITTSDKLLHMKEINFQQSLSHPLLIKIYLNTPI